MNLSRWLGVPSPPLARLVTARVALFRIVYEPLSAWPVIAMPAAIADTYDLAPAVREALAEGCALFFLAADLIDDAQDGDLPAEVSWAEAVTAGHALLFGALAAFSVAAPRGDAMREVADSGLSLASGQALDLALTWDSAPGEDDVMAAVRGKSGASLALFCRLGALAADRSIEDVATWGAIGEALGVAIQLRSDVTDIQSDRSRDFRARKATLPVVYALGRSGGAFQAAAAAGDRSAACEAIRRCGGFTFCEFKIDALALEVAEHVDRLGLPEAAAGRLKALAGDALRGRGLVL